MCNILVGHRPVDMLAWVVGAEVVVEEVEEVAVPCNKGYNKLVHTEVYKEKQEVGLELVVESNMQLLDTEMDSSWPVDIEHVVQ